MHAEAVYWALLTERHPEVGAAPAPGEAGRWLAEMLADWLQLGNRSLRDLFALHPETLAAAMGRPLDELSPLLALRARLPRVERLLAPLERAGVDLLPAWERRCPKPLRTALADVPPAIWYAGNLELLGRPAVAIAGARDSGPDGVAFARAAAAAVAGEGHVVFGGLSRAVERAALESAIAAPGGTVIAVLSQGIGGALPELQRLRTALRENRLLVISTMHPEAVWQPRLEELRGTLIIALAGRLVVAHAGEDTGIRALAQLALDRGRPVLLPAADETLQAAGAVTVSWPPESAALLTRDLLATPGRRGKAQHEPADPTDTPEEPAGDAVPAARTARRGRVRESKSVPQHAPEPGQPPEPGPEQIAAESGAAPSDGTDAALSDSALEAALLRLLRRRKSAAGKGSLVQALAAPEAAVDRALAALIAAGQIAECTQRTGVGYRAIATDDNAPRSGFQLSLFSQD